MSGATPVDDLDPLIGRARELEEIVRLVRGHRLTVLTGTGGIGKTRIAIATIDQIRVEQPAYVIDMSNEHDGSGLVPQVAATLGLADDDASLDGVADWVGSRPVVLLLDNLEQVRNLETPLVTMMRRLPAMHVLATSRVPLGIAGEHEIHLKPLALPADASADAVESAPAGTFFLARARAHGQLQGSLSESTAVEVAALCRRLDGLPLALELAAARLHLLSAGAIERRLERGEVGILQSGTKDPRHRSLEAVLHWTTELLAPEELHLLRAAAICVGEFGVELVADQPRANEALAVLDRLVSLGLVRVVDEVEDEPRFRMLETVRGAALASLGNELAELRGEHSRLVQVLVATWAPRIDGPEIRRALAHLDRDGDDIEAAIDWTVEHDPASAAALLVGLAPYFAWRPSKDVLGRLGAVLSALPRGSAWYGKVLAAMSRRASGPFGSHEPRFIRDLAMSTIAAGREAGDRDVELEGVNALAWMSFDYRSEADDLTLVAERVAAEAPRGQRQQELVQNVQIIDLMRAHGAPGLISELEDWLAASRRAGRIGQVAVIAGNLAWSLLAIGQFRRAAEIAEDGSTVAITLGQPIDEAWCRQSQAIALAELGEGEPSFTAISRAVGLVAALGNQTALVEVLLALGAICSVQGQELEGASLYGTASALGEPEVVDLTRETVVGSKQLLAARSRTDAVAWSLRVKEGLERSPREALEGGLEVLRAPMAGPSQPAIRLRHGNLTRREVEILTLVGEGLTDGQIASKLFISPKTSSVHVANVKAKLALDTRLDIALRAREMGLV